MSSLLNWSVCDVGLASFLVNHDDHTLLTMPYDQLLSMYGFDTSRLHVINMILHVYMLSH